MDGWMDGSREWMCMTSGLACRPHVPTCDATNLNGTEQLGCHLTNSHVTYLLVAWQMLEEHTRRRMEGRTVEGFKERRTLEGFKERRTVEWAMLRWLPTMLRAESKIRVEGQLPDHSEQQVMMIMTIYM